MKIEKLIKARKNHTCEVCREPILKGEKYDFSSSRSPVYNEKDIQVGIEYWKMRFHLKEQKCYMPDECKKGNHKEIYGVHNHPESRKYGDSFCYCEDCGTDLSDIES